MPTDAMCTAVPITSPCFLENDLAVFSVNSWYVRDMTARVQTPKQLAIKATKTL